jgi:uncharacterized protein (TIGR03435 family)
MLRFAKIALPVLICCSAPAQPRVFEVASIKPNHAGVGGNTGRGGSMRATPGSLVVENTSLWKLIGAAYGVGADKDYAIVGPEWLKSERFDITAKMPANTPVPQLLEMLQTLLADRFKVVVHRETRELPMYALVAARSGAKLRPSEDGATNFSMQPGRIKGQKASLTAFADRLSQFLDRPVIDATGLTGVFDLTLEWTPDPPPSLGETPAAAAGPSIFTAIQEQLGLRMEVRKGPVQVLIVDHAERVPTDN